MSVLISAMGKQRGKIGGMVCRQVPGVGTVATEYQPMVRNPRTIAQTKQRNKMNLAGQLSKHTPYEFIAGLDTNRRIARSTFVSNLLKYIGVDNQNPLSASLLFEYVEYSKGPSVNLGATIAAGTGDNTAVVTLDFSNTPETVLGANVICVFVSDGLGDEDNFVSEMKVAARADNPVTVNFSMSGVTTESGKLHFYVIPTIETSKNVRAIFASVVADDFGYNAEAVRSIAAAGGYGASRYVGVVE